VVVISFEFERTFSGNGLLARLLARGILERDCHALVDVVCAAPSVKDDRELCSGKSHAPTSTTPFADALTKQQSLRFHLTQVPVPNWNRLDANCSFTEFASLGARILAEREMWARPDVLVALDWSALRLVEALYPERSQAVPPMMFLNCRVFHLERTASEEELELYTVSERAMLTRATLSVALTGSDRISLNKLHPAADIRVLNPPLREAIKARTTSDMLQHRPLSQRKFVSFMCRVAREKRAHVFVDAMVALKELLRSLNVVPLMCGAASDTVYADQQRQRLVEHFPAAVVLEFVDAPQLADIFANTVVNVHPALIEAYGLTLIEAASFFTPSVVHHEAIGAVSERLHHDGVITTDMNSTATLVSTLREALRDREQGRLESIAQRAYNRAVEYDESQCAALFHDMITTMCLSQLPPSQRV